MPTESPSGNGWVHFNYCSFDIDLKTSLTSVNAAVEVEPSLNENNVEFTWYLK